MFWVLNIPLKLLSFNIVCPNFVRFDPFSPLKVSSLYSNCITFIKFCSITCFWSPWDRGEISIKVGTKHVIWNLKVIKRITMLTGLKVSSLACKCVFYRRQHNTKGGPHGTEFWRSWNEEMKYTNEQSSKSRWKIWGHLSSYHVYSQSYDQ